MPEILQFSNVMFELPKESDDVDYGTLAMRYGLKHLELPRVFGPHFCEAKTVGETLAFGRTVTPIAETVGKLDPKTLCKYSLLPKLKFLSVGKLSANADEALPLHLRSWSHSKVAGL
jgi:hypothetical protein